MKKGDGQSRVECKVGALPDAELNEMAGHLCGFERIRAASKFEQWAQQLRASVVVPLALGPSPERN